MPLTERLSTHAHVQTPLAMWERIKSGRTDDLKAVLAKWTKQGIWVPPRQDQAFQQACSLGWSSGRCVFG